MRPWEVRKEPPGTGPRKNAGMQVADKEKKRSMHACGVVPQKLGWGGGGKSASFPVVNWAQEGWFGLLARGPQ